MTTPSNDLESRLEACWEMGRKGQSTEGLVEAQSLLIRARRSQDKTSIAHALTCIAWFCMQLGCPDEGLDSAVEAQALFQELADDHGLGLSSSVYSWLLIELGLSDLGLEATEVALDVAMRTQDQALQAFALSCKGMALMIIRQDDLGGPIIEQALSLAEAAGDPCTIALNLINKGYSLASRAEAAIAGGNNDAARVLFQRSAMLSDRAILVARDYGDLWNLRVALCNASESYAQLGETEIAERYLEECIALPGSIGPREHIHYLGTQAFVLSRKGDHAQALTVCREALRLADEGPNLDIKMQILQLLSDIEAALGQFKPALDHHRAFHNVFVQQMDALARRRAEVMDIQLQHERLRARAVQLEAAAHEDALTGIPNRRAFELAFAGLQNGLFSLAILDLDHFKSVNDRFSHVVGDSVLTRTGAFLLAWGHGVRPFRLGGEEFALLLPDIDTVQASATLDDMRLALSAIAWEDLAPGLSVTASMGVVDSTQMSGRSMIEEADRRLYAAKAGGRNRVMGSTQLEVHRKSGT